MLFSQDRNYDIEQVEIRAQNLRERTSLQRIVIDTTILRQQQTASLGDLLIQNSNINIKSYGRGDIQTASFRGTAPSHTSVLWNGLEINSPMVGMVDFSLIPVFMIDRLSIDAGVSSLSSGIGALGGTVNIESRADWSRPWEVEILQALGSFTTSDSYINLRLGNRALQSSTKLFYSYSKNDFPFTNRDIIDPLRPGYHPRQRQENGDYRNSGFMQEFFARWSGNHSLTAIIWGLNSDRNLPQLTTYEGDKANNLTSRRDQSLRSSITYKYYGSDYEIKATLGGDIQTMGFEQQNRVATGYQTTIDSRGFSRTATARIETTIRRIKNHSFSVALDGKIDQADTYEQVRDLGFEKSRAQASLLGAWYGDWRNWLSTTVMARVGMVGTKSYISPMVGGEIRFPAGVTIKPRIGYNVHYPTISDLYYLPGGNPDLKPERGLTYELGVSYDRKSFSVAANLFDSHIEDWIIWLPSHQQYWTPQNVRSVRSSGVELTASDRWKWDNRWRLGYNATFTVNHTINNGQPMVPGDESVGKQLVYVPLVTGGVAVNVGYRNFHFDYQLYGESKKQTTTSNAQTINGTIEPYLLHNITFGYQFRWFAAQIKCDNLFDSQFYTVLRRPLPGRSFTLQLKVNLF